MKENLIRKTKWFWPWQDQEEEAWLEEMSKHGLHLKKIENLGGYVFEQGTPIDYVYRLDYREANDDEQHYLQIFADSGWQHITVTNDRQYFRQQDGQGKMPEIFTDADTKIQKYTRIKNLIVFYLALCAMVSIVYMSYPESETWSRHWWIGIIANGSGILLSGVVMAFLVAGYYKLDKRIRELRNL